MNPSKSSTSGAVRTRPGENTQARRDGIAARRAGKSLNDAPANVPFPEWADWRDGYMAEAKAKGLKQ